MRFQKSETTLQNHLAEYFRPVFRQEVIDNVTDPFHRAWLESTATITSGMFLEIAPKTNMHKMSNEQLTIALRCRIHMKLKQIIPHSKCKCKCSYDQHGAHHLIGCGYSQRIWLHDICTLQIQKTLDACDILTKHEPLHCFHAVDPNNDKRPDLIAFNLADLSNQSTCYSIYNVDMSISS